MKFVHRHASRLPAHSSPWRVLGALLFLMSMATGCSTMTPQPAGDMLNININGSASYLQRVALPPQAVLRVQLLPPASAGQSPQILAESTQQLAGRQVPVPFTLTVQTQALAALGGPPWHVRLQASVLVDGAVRFASTHPLTLNAAGAPPTVNLVLGRPSAVEPIAETRRWRGAWLTFADASTFTDCATGQRWPVAQAGDHANAERRYLQARAAPGQPLVVQLDGHLDMRLPMEGAAREHLVVDAFVAAEPGATCAEQAPATARLHDTYWKLVELTGQPVAPPPDGQREARLTLASQGQRAFGFSGCNNFSGSFEAEGPALRFKPLAGTLRACVGPAAATEAGLFTVLGNTRSHRIEGQQLTLLDENQVLARFVAVALR
jgi:heat shock protein HslJ/uncharacterized lipoprotein YbaY